MTFPIFAAGDVLRATDMNGVGLWKVASATFSGITTGAPLDVNSVFSSNYSNYVLHLRASQTGSNSSVQIRMRTVSTQETRAVYNYGWGGSFVTSTPTYNFAAYSVTNPFSPDTSYWTGITAAAGYSGTTRLDIWDPNNARQTRIQGQAYTDYNGTYYNVAVSGTGEVGTSDVYTGFRLFPIAGTISGEYTLYGYK
jgi:hypothetical protein